MVDLSCVKSEKVIFYQKQSVHKYKFWQLSEEQAVRTIWNLKTFFDLIKGVRPSPYASDVPDS